MSDPATTPTTLHVAGSVNDIPRAAWDACANPGWPSDRPLSARGDGQPANAYDPFLSHDFLWSLEESGAASDTTGWFARHLVLDDDAGRPVAIMPCYVKTHSMGEYVFDHGWADAFERAGGSYYPKLQSSVPFTPVSGRRLLVAAGSEDETLRRKAVLATAGMELGSKLGVSSLHVTFAQKDDWQVLGEAGYLLRTDQQFHFVNEGYRDFDDFLSELASRKRKTIRRERRCAETEGLEILQITGNELTEAVWDAFFDFYMDTGARKWGQPYLNRMFFSLIGERMADRLLLVMARRDGRFIAGALNVIGSDTLYGRYWGALEEIPFLHFELCYYQAMEYGIRHGLQMVEAGAQGEHKLARGYRPTMTHSAHWLRDAGFRTAVEDYLGRERHQVASDREMLADLLPFRQKDD
ncbi:MAG: GNAT family N-acetyltransferase [Alphaproteobacteria bacterium]